MLGLGGTRIPLLRYHRSSEGGERGKQVVHCPRVHRQSSDACRRALPAEKSVCDALVQVGSSDLWQLSGQLCCAWGTEVARMTAEEAGREAVDGGQAAGARASNAAGSRLRENLGCTRPVGHIHLWVTHLASTGHKYHGPPSFQAGSMMLVAGATGAAVERE